MNIIDADLLSIQEARVRMEAAARARTALASMKQEQLDLVVEAMLDSVSDHASKLADLTVQETGYGVSADKTIMNLFVSRALRSRLKGMRCVGVLHEDKDRGISEIGVPLGVIVAACPVSSPVSTTIFKASIAIKAGNALVFSLHPQAKDSMKQVLDLLIEAAESAGLPKGALSYCSHVSRAGTQELMSHKDTALVMVTGAASVVDLAEKSGKPAIIGGGGGGPAFIERTANISEAVNNIVASRSFDGGMAIAAEQSVVVDLPIDEEVRAAFVRAGAYFMTKAESLVLADLLSRSSGHRASPAVGISAYVLARRAGFMVPESTTILISYQKYVGGESPYRKEHMCPVLAYYLEEDWRDACERCIELLLVQGRGHTLVIHSTDEEVIEQFALKKPVGRLLVNAPAAFGGIGATTALFPSLTLGSASMGYGITAENVSPHHLTYVRSCGRNSTPWSEVRSELEEVTQHFKDGQKEAFGNSATDKAFDLALQSITKHTEELSRRQ